MLPLESSPFCIETARLTLRDLLVADFKPFLALSTDPAITYHQTFIRMESEAQALDWLRGAESLNRQDPRKVYSLAIIRKSDGAWLGWIGMGPPNDPALGDLDFGYAVHQRYWGQGYMTEALRGLLDFSFRTLDKEKIFGECDIENPASARVMEKAGLRFECAFPDVDSTTGSVIGKMLRYSIIRADWLASQEDERVVGDDAETAA